MYRYRIKLLAEKFDWSSRTVVKNQIIVLFKPDQAFNTDLSYFFSNYSELNNEEKVYASTIADDLFSVEEIQELLNLFGERKDIQLMIYGRVVLPFDYDKSTVGISVLPSDRKTRYITFNGAEKIDFPLAGFVRWGRQLIDKENQT